MKRKYPWGCGDSDSSRMIKNHHSEKDQELRSESAMASVHSRTLKLLFGAAKQNGPNNNDKTRPNCISCVRSLPSSDSLKNCSSCLGNTCSRCLNNCDLCNAAICGNCSIDEEKMMQKVCLGCRN